MLDWLRLKFDLQRFNDGNGPDDGNNQDPDAGGTGGDGDGGQGDAGSGGDGNKGDTKTFTQDEIDAMIERRLSRAKKQWESEQDEARKKEQMTAEERLKAEKEEAEKRAAEREAAANNRAIKAEAKALAASLGVKPDRIDYAVRLADLSSVEVDDDGEPDTRAIKVALEQVTKDLPELKGAPGKIGDPSNPGGGSSGVKGDMNAFIRRRAGRA